MRKSKRRTVEELGSYVRDKYQDAFDAKRDAYDTMLDCLRQVRGEPLSCDEDEDGVDIVMNITSPIVRGVVGLVRDVLANSIDTPFVIKATPRSDLNEASEAKLMDDLMMRLPQLIMETGGDEDAVMMEVQAMQRTAQLLQDKQAKMAADAMNTVISDRMIDAQWVRHFGDFIYNFTVFPTAVLKAPSVQLRKWKQWEGDRMTVEEEFIRGVENISPFDFYPAPYSPDVKRAEYVIERRRLTRSDLFGLKGAPGFDDEGIDLVFRENLEGFVEPYENSDESRPDADEPSSLTDEPEDFYDTLGFYGRIPGRHLKEFGIEVQDERSSYEAEVWTINDIVIKATLNPDPLGERPFYTASFEPIPGAFWGECPVTRLRDAQRMCTASVRALVRNMAYASGPIGEVDTDRINDDEDPRLVQPGMLRLVKSDRSGQNMSAYRFHTVPSLSAELTALFEKFLQYGYELIGIPRVAFGSPEGLGTIGRTSGGVAMVLNQASKSIKFALRVLEESIIEPVVQSFIDHELMYNDDPSIKGDIRVYARGVSGIVEKEAQQNKLEWALQSIAPMMGIIDPETGRPIIPVTAPLRILYQIFKDNGLSTEGIFPDFELQSAVTQDVPSSSPLIQGATFDGRNASAAQAIQASNGLVPGATS